MTRNDLVKLIYFGGWCPTYNCQATTKVQCSECHSKELTEYENKIYNQTLDDFRKRINDFLNDSADFADFVVTDGAIDCVIEELRKEVEE